jgi:hypothetical protein
MTAAGSAGSMTAAGSAGSMTAARDLINAARADR